MSKRTLLSVAACTLLSGCSVGPRYVKPTPALPPVFSESAAPFISTQAPASALWHSFGDQRLDALMATALTHNKTLEQALAQVNEARAIRGLDAFALFPTITANASSDRSLPSSRDPLVPPGIGKLSSFKAGFDAAWEVDLFGGALNTRRIAVAQEEATLANLDAARQSVLAEVAQAYFSLRAEQERLRVQTRNVANLEENQRLVEARNQVGRGTDLDIDRSRSLLLVTLARVPQTEATITRNEQRLAVLTAQSLTSLREQLGPPAPIPTMPALVTVGTPEAWLRRRPDIRQAERKLSAATAQISVDVADYFPKLTLLGGLGWTAQLASDIGKAAAERWHYGPSLTWSFLDIGRVRQRVRASKARAAGALAAYDDTVLRALEETENALAGYRAANRSATILEQAVTTARSASGLANAQFNAGAADSLVVLDAERTQLDAEDQLATAESQRATSLAALYKALVGDFAAAPAATNKP